MAQADKWKELKEKFWNGETSLEEDRQLKLYYQGQSKLRELDADEQYFLLLSFEKEEMLNDNFDSETLRKISKPSTLRRTNPWITRIAALVILALTVGLFRNFGTKSEIVDPVAVAPSKLHDDPELELAYEQAREALLLVSSKLNKGQEQTMLLGKFDQARQQVKYTIEQ